MNQLFFGCTTCHIFVDAGYRHAYWTLEDTGVVSRSTPVDAHAVFDAEEYWEVDAQWQWLVKLLPAVRTFLEAHEKHQIMFGDGEELGLTPAYDGDYRLFDWLMEAGDVYEELPRYYVERMGFRQWDQVVEHNSTGDPPWWWGDDEYRNAAEQKFLSLVTSQTLNDTSNAG
jgi:hypothetical protein